jgi:hypothetical protein
VTPWTKGLLYQLMGAFSKAATMVILGEGIVQVMAREQLIGQCRLSDQ